MRRTLERRRDVVPVTLARYADAPPIVGDVTDAALADAVERAMGEAGFSNAHPGVILAACCHAASRKRSR